MNSQIRESDGTNPIRKKYSSPAASGQHSHHPLRENRVQHPCRDDKRPANLLHMLILPEHPGNGLHIYPHPSLHEFRQENKEREIDDHHKDERQSETGSYNGKSTSLNENSRFSPACQGQ